MSCKFKVGDRVERIYCANGPKMPVGYIGIVTDIERDLHDYRLYFENGLWGSSKWYKKISSPSESPIRVKTSREIVPGVYGKVVLWTGTQLNLGPKIIKYGISMTPTNDPEELRSIAKMINDIADVLEENSK